MTIQRGKMNLSVYKIESNPHADKLELLEDATAKAAMPICEAETIPDGISIGFASGKILLDRTINADNSIIDGYVTLNVRSTAKKIDAGMLKALIQCEEAAYMKARNAEFVPRKERNRIKEEAIERLMKDAKLSVKGTEIVIDGDRLLIGATSERDCDTVCDLIAKDLGIMPGLVKHSNAKGETFGAGREFLAWLFTTVQSGAELPGDVKAMIEGPLELFAPDTEDYPDCAKAKIEGGTVANSVELNTMLDQKKHIRKAKLSLVRGEDAWRFTFDADAWNFSGLELPKDCETFADRIQAIRDLYDEMDGLFNAWKTAQAAALGIQELPNMEKK